MGSALRSGQKEQEIGNLLAVLDGVDDVIYVADPESYELLYVNAEFERLWQADVEGKRCYRVLQGRDAPCPFCTNEKIFGEYLGETLTWEFQNELTRRWYRCRDSAIAWGDGRMVRMEIARDITEQIESKEALHESEERFKNVVNLLPDFIYCMQLPEGKYSFLSQSCEEVLGWPAAALLEDSSLFSREVLHPDWRDYFAERWAELLRGEVSSYYEYEVLEPNGQRRWIHQRNLLLFNDQGEPDQLWGIVSDLSELKAAEIALKERVKELTCMRQVSALLEGPEASLEEVVLETGQALGRAFLHPAVAQVVLEGVEFKGPQHDLSVARLRQTIELEGSLGFLEVGYLEHYESKDDGPFLKEESSLLKVVAEMLASYISRRRAHQALEQHRRSLEERIHERTAELEHRSKVSDAVNRILRESTQCRTAAEVAERALALAEQLTGSAFGFIGELNAMRKLDTIAISNPGWGACAMEGQAATCLIYDMELRGIWASVLREGRAKIINAPTLDPDYFGVPEGHPPLRSFIGVPFVTEGRALGLVALANKEGGYSERDLSTLQSLAGPFYEALQRKRLEEAVRAQARAKSIQAELSQRLVKDKDLESLSETIIGYLCRTLGAPSGLIYIANEQGLFEMKGAYAHQQRAGRSYSFASGEGLVGQCAQNRAPLELDLVPEYYSIDSGLASLRPCKIWLVPVLHAEQTKAVLEFALLKEPSPEDGELLESLNEGLVAAIESVQAREIQGRLLVEAQRLAASLQTQQEELRASNEELEEHSERLRISESSLKTQQEELQVTNEELEEKTQLLESQKEAVEVAQAALKLKAEALAQANQYKTEFLANMSHELRTPLNSLLLLARALQENREKNLSSKQLESIQIIYEGGNELLSLINELLDLSKIEAGQMDFHLEEVQVVELVESIEISFRELAQEKGLSFEVEIEEESPQRIFTDCKRTLQVIRNLISNALKFTERGGVHLRFSSYEQEPADPGLLLSISDTGIGIAPEKQQAIFEAFRQGDGTTARRYGGTGLGLSIVKEFCSALGIELELESQLGEGTTFKLRFPDRAPISTRQQLPAETQAPLMTFSESGQQESQARAFVADDREELAVGERSILIIEDDRRFATILVDHCRNAGLKVLVTNRGQRGLYLAQKYRPRGVLLDLKLPDIDGWQVLAKLKENPATRHIPVHIASVEEPSARAQQWGALGHLQKPVSLEEIEAAIAKICEVAQEKQKMVLVVEDDEATRKGLVELISDTLTLVDSVAGGADALAALRKQNYDCVIVDLSLWDFDGDELLRRAQREGVVLPPVVVYTARNLTWEEDLELRSYSDSIIIKSARSDERLLEELSLFLHRVVAEMPEEKKQIITNLHDVDAALRGKTALIVDDDMRALFAITQLLSERGMQTLKAENGERALALLAQGHEIDIVLMDIMMPIMDGFETMRRIRSQEKYKRLPIIALTAKAMKGDQERCIEAGASDYLPKPVDPDRLFSMLRVWLYR